MQPLEDGTWLQRIGYETTAIDGKALMQAIANNIRVLQEDEKELDARSLYRVASVTQVTCDFVGIMSRPPVHARNVYPGIDVSGDQEE